MSVLDKTLEAAVKAAFLEGRRGWVPASLPPERGEKEWMKSQAFAALSATSAGVTEEQVEALADFLCSEFDADFNPVVGAVWPEHADDDGYRGNRAYVRLQPSDVQAHARDNARRILTFLGQRSPASRVAPVSQKEAVPVKELKEFRIAGQCNCSGCLRIRRDADAARSALHPSPTPVSAPVGVVERKVRFARAFGNDRMEMGRSLPTELYRIGDTILVWANEGDLCFYGQEFARSPAVVEGK